MHSLLAASEIEGDAWTIFPLLAALIFVLGMIGLGIKCWEKLRGGKKPSRE